MKILRPTTVFDPTNILPSYGENRIALKYESINLYVTVFFDSLEGESKFVLIFESVKFFHLGGHSLNSGFEYEKYEDLSALVEYQASDVVKNLNLRLQSKYRHFKILFLSANESLEVVSKHVKIETYSNP